LCRSMLIDRLTIKDFIPASITGWTYLLMIRCGEVGNEVPFLFYVRDEKLGM